MSALEHKCDGSNEQDGSGQHQNLSGVKALNDLHGHPLRARHPMGLLYPARQGEIVETQAIWDIRSKMLVDGPQLSAHSRQMARFHQRRGAKVDITYVGKYPNCGKYECK
jgi:hypothetical protein